jgi:DUF4097 and DUF4098 domain-containing protein YvlB
MTNWEFPCSDPIDIDIDSWASGSVAIAGEPTQTVTVEVTPANSRADAQVLEEVRVTFDGQRLKIAGPKGFGRGFSRHYALDLTVRAPAGSRCDAHTASADVNCVGELGALTVQTASGDVSASSVTGDTIVRSASGDVMLRSLASDAQVNTASGDVHLDRVGGEARVNTVSGDVTIAQCPGPVAAHTVSGDIDLGAVASGKVSLNSVSGDLAVSVVPGIGLYLDLASTSGDIRNELDESDGDDSGPALEIKCRTLSGDVRIRRAPGQAVAAQPA